MASIASTTHRPPIDVSEAAAYLGLSDRHVRRLVQERRVPFLKVAGSRVKFRPGDLDAWLEGALVEASR